MFLRKYRQYRLFCILVVSFLISAWGCQVRSQTGSIRESGSDSDESRTSNEETRDSSGGEDTKGLEIDTNLQEDSDPSSHDEVLNPTPDCTQPQSKADCEDGWCRIPSGCFVFGSRNSEGSVCKAKYAEKQVQVTLTHDFEMKKVEVTQAEWEQSGFQLPNRLAKSPCPNCPVSWITIYDAMAYCNALSKKAKLPECYDLSDCQGTIGAGCPDNSLNKWGCEDENLYVCKGKVAKFAPHKCPGYRLPTQSEWEYAARAGTTTATYKGDFEKPMKLECRPSHVVDPIAWHCGNSSLGDDPVYLEVSQKEPNAYGLFDILGNVGEFCESTHYNKDLEQLVGQTGPLVDPAPPLEAFSEKMNVVARGCHAMAPAACCRSAAPIPGQRAGAVHFAIGFRPVRTLNPSQ